FGARSPAFRRYSSVAAVVAVVAAVAAVAVATVHISAGFLVLVSWLLIVPPLFDLAASAERRSVARAAVVSAAIALLVIGWLLRQHGAVVLDYLVLCLAAVVTMAVAANYRRVNAEKQEGQERYSALLSEYRNLKRAAATTAEAARAEERMSVARRLHDSVGHRLTSLLMQLESDSLASAGDDQRRRADELKRLAQLSLDETRAAVTALSEGELTGMPALLRLIHNLEVESAMQVEFTLGSGALTVTLDQAPAVAMYRAIQEALTNAMRHGVSRRARVRVEVPAGRLVRFEVENDVAPGTDAHRPGFGLTTMRERVEAAGGQLEVMAASSSFLVRGSFPVQA